MDFQREALEEALETLGAVLQDRGTPFELLAIGGSGLLLLRLIDRPTGDLDVIAALERGAFRKLESLPEPLETAARQVGEALGLSARWLNTGPSSLLDLGLPEGWESRLRATEYGALCLHVPSREDQICFKLYATIDQGPRSKHYADLKALEPTCGELLFAGRWTVAHDPSDAFREELVKCLATFGVEFSDDDRG